MATPQPIRGSGADAVPAADPDRHLRTDTLRAGLRERSVRSGFINLGGQGAQFLLGAASTMVLARLLTPADFGLFAMVVSLTAFVETFRDFGFSMAVMHSDAVNHERLSRLFWFHLRLNTAIALFIGAMAPVLSWFYDEPRLMAITPVVALGTFGLSLGLQHESILKRQMRFGAHSLLATGAMLAGGLAAITAALLGAGYWSLVLMFLTSSLVRSAGAWLVCGWRPAMGAARRAGEDPHFRSLISYGGFLTAYRILAHVGTFAGRVLVGHVAGAGPLGLYENAYKWSTTPVMQVQTPLQAVAVSSMSRWQNSPQVYRAYARQGLLPAFALSLPVIAFTFVETRRVVLVLLGDQWLEAVPLVRLFCVAAFAQSLLWATQWLYLSQGNTRRQFLWGLISTPIMVASVAVGLRWGTTGVAAGFTLATCLIAVPGVAFCLKTSHLRLRDFAGTAWRPIVASIGAAALLALWGPGATGPGSVAGLAVRLLSFGLGYLLLWIALPGGLTTSRAALRTVTAAWAR